MNEVDKQVIKEAVQEVIKDTVYEVIEPFVARMAKDYEENRRWMRSIDQRMDKLEQRMDKLEQRMSALEQRMDSLERRVGRLEVEMHEVKQRMESLEQRLAERGFVESEAIAHERWATFNDLKRVELRVTQLEAAVFHQVAEEKTTGVE